MSDNDDYKLPVDHPILASVCGFIYDLVFEPINKLIDRVTSYWNSRS